MLKNVFITFLIELAGLILGALLVFFPLFQILELLGANDSENTQSHGLSVSIDRNHCQFLNLATITLFAKEKGPNIGVFIDFPEWEGFTKHCDRVSIDISGKISSLHTSAPIGKKPTKNIVSWNDEAGYTTIHLNGFTREEFAGSVQFVSLNSLYRSRLGHQIHGRFFLGTNSSIAPKGEIEVTIPLQDGQEIGFAVPSISSIVSTGDRPRVSFLLGEDGGILLSVIDRIATKKREISLIWYSAIIGVGFSFVVGAILAILRDIVKQLLARHKT